jgi:hypothetical protein
MTTLSTSTKGRGRAILVAVAVMVLPMGCNLTKKEIPDLSGPSELALSVNLTAAPDVLVADGASTAAIQATVRNENAQPLAGRPIFFSIASAGGGFADIGELSSTTAVTGPSGTAQVVYRAPVRTDFTANSEVLVVARPIGTDAAGALYRSVTIELRSAEGRLFPENPANTAPTCKIVVETPDGFKTNHSILFQTGSFDTDGTIVRYFWTFGDDTPPSDNPDVNHVYTVAGSYTVNHIVTDNNGLQSPCTVDVEIVD